MNKVKLSVVVPVYKVEDYIVQCLESIVNQTFKELEIILVDDGSPDSSGMICDRYKLKDERILVIHKENGGLSSARNMGIEHATGQYITFVDSDDYIELDMYEKMMNIVTTYDCDIVCCDCKSDWLPSNPQKDEKLKVMTMEDAIVNILDEAGYRAYSCNKVYKKEMFKDIRFPEGKCYEDIYTNYILFGKSKTIGYLNEELYIYRYREESISNESFNDNKYDLLFAINLLIKDAREKNKYIYRALLPGYVRYYFYFISSAYRNDVVVKPEQRYLKMFILKNYFGILFSPKVTKRIFLQSTCFLISCKLYRRILMKVK